MINLSASGGSVTFEFIGNSGYLQDGTITVPVNSLSMIIDESDMVTFRKPNNDVFISALLSEFGMTKEEMIAWYKANMVGSTGGGGITSGEVQTMIDESVSGKADVSAATIVNQTSGTVTGSTATTYGGASVTFNFEYNDGVTSFSAGCVGMVAFDNPRTPAVKYKTKDGEEKTAVRGSDTDEYNYENIARKVVITMKGNNRLTYVWMGYEDPVTINYTYDYVINQSVAASTYIENTINPKIETIESSLSAKADTSAVTAVNNVVTAHTADTSIHFTTGDVQSMITSATSGLQETLSAGTNIDITNNVISVTGISIETSSAVTSGDVRPIQSGALYDELRIPGEVESGLTLEWYNYDGGSTINYPSGQCSKIIFENIAAIGETEGDTWYEPGNGFNFNDSEGFSIGYISLDVDYNGVITITNATNVTYSIDGNNLTVEYPSIAANVDHIDANYDNYWTTTAFVNVSGMIPLINQVSANTAAISGKADTSAVTAVNNTLTAHTADTSIHFTTGDVQSMITAATSGKADTSAVTAVQDSLSGYVTTDTEQEITAQKIFIGDPTNGKKSIKFKQYDNASKVGFVMVNSASTNNELAAFEFRPNTYTDSSSVQHPLLYFGHYRNNSVANAGVVQTMLGFRQYDQSGAAAYHYLLPLPAEAKTPFSLTTSFKNYFAPLGFKNGSTMITTDNTGVADFSGVLGGLKLQQITQADYDALVSGGTVDSSTLYIITNVVS